MLIAALRTAQMNVRQMTLVKREIDAFLAREQKQMERLELALEAIQRDVAYYRSLDEMLSSREEDEKQAAASAAAAIPVELQAAMDRVAAREQSSEDAYPWRAEQEAEYQRVDDWLQQEYPVANGWAREPDRADKEAWLSQFSDVRPGEYDASRVSAPGADSYSSWRQDAEDRYQASGNGNGYSYGSGHSELDGYSSSEESRREEGSSDWRDSWRSEGGSNGSSWGTEEGRDSWWRGEPQDSGRSSSSRGWDAPEPEPAPATRGKEPDWMDNWRNLY